MDDNFDFMKRMYDETVVEIRKTYGAEEWFENVTDAEITRAWGEKSEDSCASWLGYNPGERSESFESYLKAIIAENAPIDMVLFCPNCMHQHIDAKKGDWRNPPHRSHLCDTCGFIWRPADVATNGVAQIKTKGERDGALGDIDILVFTSEELLQLLEGVRDSMAQMIEKLSSVAFQLDFKGILRKAKKR